MPVCDSCGVEVHKLSVHPVTKKNLCMKCLIEAGSFRPDLEDLDPDTEKRASIRIPLTLVMSVELDGAKTEKTFAGYSLDISMRGICFGWPGCASCPGYTENGIHEKCIFHPHAAHTPGRQPFLIKIDLSREVKIEAPAYAVYTLKDESINIEYVGARFTDLDPAANRMLEELIIKNA